MLNKHNRNHRIQPLDGPIDHDYGNASRLQTGPQYSYLTKYAWTGFGTKLPAPPGANPTAVNNMWFTSFRYYLPKRTWDGRRKSTIHPIHPMFHPDPFNGRRQCVRSGSKPVPLYFAPMVRYLRNLTRYLSESVK